MRSVLAEDRLVPRTVSVADRDPGLLAGVPAPLRPAARQALRAVVAALPAGPVGDWPGTAEPAFGLLLLHGTLLREMPVGIRFGLELVVPGDLLRPRDEPALVGERPPRWRALETCDVALLDHAFTVRAAPYPAVAAALLGRVMERHRRGALLLALRALPRVEDRVLAVLWSLADQLGRVTYHGVEVRLRLRQADLAEMAGARRPTVNLTLRLLREQGLLRAWSAERYVLDPRAGGVVAARLDGTADPGSVSHLTPRRLRAGPLG